MFLMGSEPETNHRSIKTGTETMMSKKQFSQKKTETQSVKMPKGQF